MRDDDDRARELAEEPLEDLLAREVQVVVRLVEQQEIRIGDEACREADELPLPAGQHRQRSLPLVLGDPEIAQEAGRAIPQAWAAGALEAVQEPLLVLEGGGQARHVTADVGVGEAPADRAEIALDRREVRPRAQQRRHDGHLRRLLLLREVRDAQVARPRHEAAFGELEAGDGAEQRRLPAAVRADEADPRVPVDGPGEVREDRAVAVRSGNAREVGHDHAVI